MGVDRNLLARIAFRTCISLNETRTMVSMTSNGSGVGVIDKAAMVLSALEAGPASLAELVSLTGLARPTAHRLAVALEFHRIVGRDLQGRFVLGPRLAELSSAAGEDRLLAAAGPVLGRATRPANRRGSSAARAICACAWPRPNAPWVCATRCRSGRP